MNPYISHPLVAALDTLLLSMLAGAVLHLAGVTVPYLPLIAAVVVSGVYYGREAGQREHDLKNLKKWGWFTSFAGGKYAFGWSVDNLLQWLAAAAGSLIAGVTLQVFL